MNPKKISIIVVIFAIFLILPFFLHDKKEDNKENSQKPNIETEKIKTTINNNWKEFSDQTKHISFLVPDYLFPFFEDDRVNFREYKEGPGFIDIHLQASQDPDVEKAVEKLNYVLGEITDRRMIDGAQSLIVPLAGEGSAGQKTLYTVREGILYTINTRFIEEEKFWNSIKFLN